MPCKNCCRRSKCVSNISQEIDRESDHRDRFTSSKESLPRILSKPSHFRFRHDSRPCRCRLSVRDDSPPPPATIDGQLKWRPMTDQKCPVLNSKLTNQPLLPLSLEVGSSTSPNKKVHRIDSSPATWKKRMSLIFVAPLLVGFLVRQFNRRRREESWEH